MGIDGKFLNFMMFICSPPSANIIVSGKKLNESHLDQVGTRQDWPLSPFAVVFRKEKGIKCIDGRKDAKLTLFAVFDIIIYVERKLKNPAKSS